MTATVISTAIQVPFLLMLNMGVHSKIGGFGYIFYYPWIALLDHLGTSAWQRWENDLLVFEAVLAGGAEILSEMDTQKGGYHLCIRLNGVNRCAPRRFTELYGVPFGYDNCEL